MENKERTKERSSRGQVKERRHVVDCGTNSKASNKKIIIIIIQPNSIPDRDLKQHKGPQF